MAKYRGDIYQEYRLMAKYLAAKYLPGVSSLMA